MHRSLHARRTRLRRAHWESSASEASPPYALCTPERTVEATQLWACLEGTLAELQAEYRAVLALRELDGLEYQEISERLDLPLGTVRSQLSRARVQLRDSLAQWRSCRVRAQRSREPRVATDRARSDPTLARVRSTSSGTWRSETRGRRPAPYL